MSPDESTHSRVSQAVGRIPSIIRQLYGLVAELESTFPGRRFTPDGHLVGSIGEVLASHFYDLKLLRSSSQCHDALTQDSRAVQIKATQANRVALRSQPDHLLVLKISRNGSFEEIYNGPGELPWNSCSDEGSTGQRQISVTTLRKLMKDVPLNRQLPKGA